MAAVTKSVVIEEVKVEDQKMDARLMQNPTSNQFTVIIHGNRIEAAEIMVFDMLGGGWTILERRRERSVNFGGSYVNGVYLVEVVQGTERKVLKAVKQ